MNDLVEIKKEKEKIGGHERYTESFTLRRTGGG
jgi:hypothetical protein